MYIVAELHYGINPECNAKSGNKMIRTTETEFTWKNKPEHGGAQLLSNGTPVNLLNW